MDGDGGGPPTCHKVGGERAKGSFMRFIIDKINCKNHVLLLLHCLMFLQIAIAVAIFCSNDKVYVKDHFTVYVHTIYFFQLEDQDDCLEIAIKNPLNSKLNLTFLWVFERTLLFSSDFLGY